MLGLTTYNCCILDEFYYTSIKVTCNKIGTTKKSNQIIQRKFDTFKLLDIIGIV